MKPLLKALRGRKTYILAALLFITGGLEALGVLPADVAGPLKTFLAAGSIASLRAAK